MSIMVTYTDFSLTFRPHPGTNDILETNDVSAVMASMKNILLSGPFDSPFNPNYGGNLRSLLFELLTPATISIAKRHITLSLAEFEPRVVIQDLYIGDDNHNGVNIGILFYVQGNPTLNTFNFTLNRVR